MSTAISNDTLLRIFITIVALIIADNGFIRIRHGVRLNRDNAEHDDGTHKWLSQLNEEICSGAYLLCWGVVLVVTSNGPHWLTTWLLFVFSTSALIAALLIIKIWKDSDGHPDGVARTYIGLIVVVGIMFIAGVISMAFFSERVYSNDAPMPL